MSSPAVTITGVQSRHQPVLVQSSTPGVWIAICDACSDEQGDYVNTCEKPNNNIPFPKESSLQEIPWPWGGK